MAKKPNPLLAEYEAKLQRRFSEQLKINTEINLIASLIAANDEIKVGAGRAGNLLARNMEIQMQIATEIINEDDPELLYTKYGLATRLKQILGKENWMKYREVFPLLREYWEWD